ncbi:OLC1v1012189C1 [Oldenlandia corymbosa var. corymbosa]|uniref:OLC1v1012189C1 n=1 Tax=Oldenlandia corymbosa var. corymbosa TaxID=529605 RepID=A0AAV1DVK0_OLDCO|nr:OLC1v1012189C1 [Oldenlandia corymbosa var. corymbosa]
MASSHLMVVMLLIVAMAGHSSGASWCMCKDLPDAVLQKTLDFACGAGADCNPTHQSGPCFNPNTVRAHCNYAVNSYFQHKGQAQGSCDFTGTASVVNNDPSSAGCVYPASASATTTNNPTTGTTTVNGPTTTGTNPMITTPTGSGGIGGGINNGLGPPGNGMSTDSMGNDGGFSFLMKDNNMSPTTLLLCSFTTFIALLSWWA